MGFSGQLASAEVVGCRTGCALLRRLVTRRMDQVGSPGLCYVEFLLQLRNHRGIIVQDVLSTTEGDRPRHPI